MRKLLATFENISHANFLAAVKASYNYKLDHVAWQHEAENAIEPLEQMAKHGDASAFNSLVYLGSKIAVFLENLALWASDYSTTSDGNHLTQRDRSPQNDENKVDFISSHELEILASLTDEKLESILKTLESSDPGENSEFLPQYLLRISRRGAESKHIRFRDAEELHDPKFSKLEPLTKKLAAVRAKDERARMVQKALARAEIWPVALSSIQELRTVQLEKYDALKIGSGLSIRTSPPQGRGKSIGLKRGGSTTFAYDIYLKLDKERTRPRNPIHLADIRESYNKYQRQGSERKVPGSKNGKAIKASECQPWNKQNEWKAEAALLAPLSPNKSVVESWYEAGMKLVAVITEDFSRLESLPRSLRDKATNSNALPSKKRIKKVTSDALKNGLESIAPRITHADQGGENIAG